MADKKVRVSNESMYWDSQNLVSRNAMFNFTCGGRGVGKTFDFKVKRIRHFLKTSKQFIYLRRYKTEFMDKDTFFDDVLFKFPNQEFRVEGMRGFIRDVVEDGEKEKPWRLLCRFVCLSNALTKKSVPMPEVDWIGFDEFIIDKGSLHYLKNEVKAFLDYYVTVDRFQDRVKVMFMANAVSIVNPYFLYYGINPRRNQQFISIKDGFGCCEMVRSEKFQKHVDTTRFGRAMQGTSYYEYAVGNQFADNNNMFILKKPKRAEFYYAFKFDERTVGVWVDYQGGCYYVCGKYPKDALVYALTKSDMAPNLLMIEKSNVVMKSLLKLFMQGSVFFDTVRTREFCNDVFSYLGM